MKTVILTIGCPGSGKSFAAKKYIKENFSDKYSVTINADDLREKLTGSQNDFSKDKTVWGILYNNFHAALEDDIVDVIAITNTSINFKSRKKYYKILQKYCYDNEVTVDMVFLVFRPDVDACMELQKNRSRAVPRAIVQNFADRFEEPTVLSDMVAVGGNSSIVEFSTKEAVKAALEV